MIFKYELIEAINDTNHDLALVSVKLSDLEAKVEKLEAKLAKCECKCKKETKSRKTK